jgi:hypothetical protein
LFKSSFSSRHDPYDNDAYRPSFKTEGDDFDDYDDLIGNGYVSEGDDVMGDLEPMEPMMEVDFHEKPERAVSGINSI